MSVRVIQGDCREALRGLPDASVQCCVTSPPYFGLRDYGVGGQIGLEPTLAEYVANLVAVFREVRRVLRDDGTCWLNLGDSYANVGAQYGGTNSMQSAKPMMGKGTWRKPTDGLKVKDLCGIPWRVAFALQDDGWYLRSDIIWAKPNPMPESVRDRPTKSHEYIFLLSKQPRYFWDAEAVKEDAVKGYAGSTFTKGKTGINGNGRVSQKERHESAGRNIRTVWTIATAPFAEAHFATFPPALAERCIKAGTSEKGACAACGAPWRRVVERDNPSKWAADHENTMGFNNNGRTSNPQSSKSLHRTQGGVYSTAKILGWQPSCACDAETVPCVVLDPFAGAGTVGLVADRLNRDAVLIELNPDYCQMMRDRIRGDAPLFAGVV